MEANPDVALTFSDHYIMFEDGTTDLPATELNTVAWGRANLPAGRLYPFAYEGLIQMSIPIIASTVYRRSALNFSRLPELTACYDLWLLYLAVKSGGAAWYVPERLGRVRVHAGSETMKGRDRVARAFITLYEEFMQDEELRSIWPDFRHPLGLQLSSLGYLRLREGKNAEARELLRRGMRFNPCLRSFLRLACGYVPVLLRFRELLRRHRHPVAASGPELALSAETAIISPPATPSVNPDLE